MEVRTRLQFRILGPLEVARGGQPVRLRGERQRALLARLLLRGGELVSAERLTDELFGGQHAPGGADGHHARVNALHAAVSRLRRVLGDDGVAIVTRPGGYALELETEQLDAACFETAMRAGRGLLAAGRPAEAAARLDEALALWRGAVLADVSTDGWAEPEIHRLEELHLLARMERIEAGLALGEAASLISELEHLVTRHPLQERLVAQLMLALYRSGRQAEALAVYREAAERLRGGLGLEPTRELRELELMILRQDGELTASPAAVEPTVSVVCPFKGLSSFGTADAEFFSGRERLVAELVARLAESALIGILGSSGAGKSSLLHAGLLPRLRGGGLPGSARWRLVALRPGERPLSELDRALAAIGELASGERLVLAVDQLEEVFGPGISETERAAFLDRLAGAAGDEKRRVVVVCALRADFYGRLSPYGAFAELLSREHLLVGPMDRDELRQAIEEPAARAGLVIEPALVQALVADVGSEAGALPLLSTTLLELWKQREGGALSFAAYRRSGGVRGAVGRLAERAFRRLNEDQRRIARGLFLRLAIGEDGAAVRRRADLCEIEQIDGAAEVVAILADERLLTIGEGAVELSHEALLQEWPRYRSWLEEDSIGRRLHSHLIVAAQEWRRRQRDPAELYRGARLSTALEWAAADGALLNAHELEFLEASRLASERAALHQRRQNQRLRALLVAAAVLLLAAVTAAVIAVSKQRNATRAARAAAGDARAALGRQLGLEAVGEPRLDLAMLLAREAVRLDRSVQTEGTLLATLLRAPAVVGSFATPSGVPLTAAASPAGGALALGDAASGRVIFYRDAHGVHPTRSLSGFAGHGAPVFSSDGAYVAYPAAQAGRTAVALADPESTEPPAVLRLTPAAASTGTMLIAAEPTTLFALYSARGRHYLDRFSLLTGQLSAVRHVGPGALALHLEDGGARLMVISSRSVQTFDALTLRGLASREIASPILLPSAAAVRPDGRQVAIASWTGSLTLIDAASGRVRRSPAGRHPAIVGLAYHGATIASAATDGSVTEWDDRTAAPTATLPAPPDQVQSAAAGDGGATLYTVATDGEGLVWNLDGREGLGLRTRISRRSPCCDPLAPALPALSVSADGSRFASQLDATTIGIFSTRTLNLERSLTVPVEGAPITALAWSPRAPVLAVGGHGGMVDLWGLSGTPRRLRSLTGLRPPPGEPEAIQALAFSADGARVAALDESISRTGPHAAPIPASYLAEWDAATGQPVTFPRNLEAGANPDGHDALVASQDGQLLAARAPGGRVAVVDDSGETVAELSAAGGATSLAFAPDGRLAAGTGAGTIQIWSPRDWQPAGPPVVASSALVDSLDFDRSGALLASSGAGDGSVKLWSSAKLQPLGPALPLEPGGSGLLRFASQRLLALDDVGAAFAWPISLAGWEQRACSVAGRELAPREWAELIAGTRYARVCP